MTDDLINISMFILFISEKYNHTHEILKQRTRHKPLIMFQKNGRSVKRIIGNQ